MTEGNIGNQVNRALAGGTAVGHRVVAIAPVMAGRIDNDMSMSKKLKLLSLGKPYRLPRAADI